MMLNQFKQFSRSTSLVANMGKCKLFFGVGTDILEAIMVRYGMLKGELPVKYLRVPYDCRNLSIVVFAHLIEKIICMMTHWTIRLLSYAGRL